MESTSAPTHTQIVTPGTTDTSHHRLRIAATVCWKLFERCTKVSPSHLGRNYGKFKVWCGNLGVRQGGHASLDWRLKDDDVMENEVFSMLTDLEDDLQQVLELLSGTRLPYEQEERGSETSSLNESLQPGELEVRLDAIGATITALYQMSFLVRNQGTRRLASAKAQNYQPRDPDEAALLESFVSFDRQHIDDLFRDLRRPRSDDGQPMATRPDLRSDGDAQDKAIKARCLTASTARRRQLAYWKMHSSKLKSIAVMPETAELDQNATIYSGTEASGVFKRIERDFDMMEVQSLGSVASTVRDIDGHETEFPGPPERSSDDDPFECPYCYVLCQPEEAGKHQWKKHILEDLRPYICTYPECQNGTQLYGNRREWTTHEDDAHRFSMKSELGTSIKRAVVDDRTQCPICLLDVADLPRPTGLTKHLASHLERFSLDCLPLNTSSWGNENLHDDVSESSDPDQGLPLEHHEHNARNEQQEMITESSEAQTEEDYRVEKVLLSEEAMREIELGQLLTPAESELLRENYKRSERRTQGDAEREELSISEEKIPAEINAERKQVIKEYQRRRPESEEESITYGDESRVNYESYDSGTEDNSRDNIDAERKRITEDHERTERGRKGHEQKEQEDRIVAGLARSREDISQHEAEREDVGQDKSHDTLVWKGLAEADLAQVQVGEMTTKEQGSKQAPASSTPKTVSRPAGGPARPHAPVYPKVHTDHMAIEALRYYDTPWEYDQSDSSYIIILRELDGHELDILFEYTKRLRERRMFVNESGAEV